MTAISWWVLPHTFEELIAEQARGSTEDKLFKVLALNNHPKINSLLQSYIDFTGTQQYWDFFAPQSPKYHQYLSICDSITKEHMQDKIECGNTLGFSNLDAHLDEGANTFRFFGSDRSRYYRLTENLVKLEDRQLLTMFAEYYARENQDRRLSNALYLVKHEFELHPELVDLPESGYRMDKIIWSLP